MRILIAETNASVRDMLSAACALIGDPVEAILFADGPCETRYMAEALDVDIVVMDVMPAGIEGIRAIKCLRASGFNGDIISLSSAAYGEIAPDALEAGATWHLCKPFLLEDLIGLIGGGGRRGFARRRRRGHKRIAAR